MLTAKYQTTGLIDNTDSVKISALYFDRIEIIDSLTFKLNIGEVKKPKTEQNPDNMIIEQKMLTQNFKQEISMLENEGIVTFIEDPVNGNEDEEIWKKVQVTVAEIIAKNRHLLYHFQAEGKDTHICFKDEAAEIAKLFFNPGILLSQLDVIHFFIYYSTMFRNLLFFTAKGDGCITSSDILHSLTDCLPSNKELFKKQGTLFPRYDGPSPSIAFESIKLSLPDISQFSIEDILEIRYQLRDELEAFRYEMENLKYNLLEKSEQHEVEFRAREIVKFKVKPRLDDLKLKVDSSKIVLLGNLAKELKNPSSYLPFLGTVFGQLPAHIATLASVGLVGTTAYLEHLKASKEYKQNGLYYLLKLNKYRKS